MPRRERGKWEGASVGQAILYKCSICHSPFGNVSRMGAFLGVKGQTLEGWRDKGVPDTAAGRLLAIAATLPFDEWIRRLACRPRLVEGGAAGADLRDGVQGPAPEAAVIVGLYERAGVSLREIRGWAAQATACMAERLAVIVSEHFKAEWGQEYAREIKRELDTRSPLTEEGMAIAEHLRTRRLQLGYTIKEIAAKVGIPAVTVTNWESGRQGWHARWRRETPGLALYRRTIETLAPNDVKRTDLRQYPRGRRQDWCRTKKGLKERAELKAEQAIAGAAAEKVLAEAEGRSR